MILKLIITLFVLVIPIMEFFRDWKFQDRRTNINKRFNIGLITCSLILIPLTIYQIWIDDNDNENNKKTLQNISNSQVTVSKGQMSVSEGQISVSKSQEKLLIENEFLKQKSDSCFTSNQNMIIELKKYQIMIQQKNLEIDKLKNDLKFAEEGKTISYDYSGNRRESNGHGSINIEENTPEKEAFKKLSELYNSHQYQEIINYCSKLIKLNSHWYTPFVFRGVAYANLKNKSKAIEDLTFAVKHTPSDPDYQEARELLQKVKDLPN